MQTSRTEAHPARVQSPTRAPSRYPHRVPGDEPSIGEALERVYEAGQGVLASRIERLSEDLAGQGRLLLVSAILVGSGALIALAGWAIVVAGALDAADEWVPRYTAEIAIGAVHCLVGAIVAYRGLRSGRSGERESVR